MPKWHFGGWHILLPFSTRLFLSLELLKSTGWSYTFRIMLRWLGDLQDLTLPSFLVFLCGVHTSLTILYHGSGKTKLLGLKYQILSNLLAFTYATPSTELESPSSCSTLPHKPMLPLKPVLQGLLWGITSLGKLFWTSVWPLFFVFLTCFVHIFIVTLHKLEMICLISINEVLKSF